MFNKKICSFLVLLITLQTIHAQVWDDNGSDLYFIEGNVGIGTASPNSKLELKSTSFSSGLLRLSSSATGANSLNIAAMGTGESTGGGGRSNIASYLFQRASDGADLFQLDLTNRQAYFIGGNVGIGTTQPSSRFHVDGGILGTNTGDKVPISTFYSYLQSGNNSYLDVYNYRNKNGTDWLSTSTRIEQRIDATTMGYLEFNPPNMAWGMALGTNNTPRLIINQGGQVGIGTSQINDNTYALFVVKGIRTRKVKVDQDNWPDYVFAPAYRLRPLSEVAQFIQQHHHLPEMPSAEEVKKNGIDLGDNQALLLKKIEELTLYIIEMKNENDKAKEEMMQKISDQQKQIETLKLLARQKYVNNK